MLSADSPFSNGQGNDYLFAGNMVYTVSVVLEIYTCLLLFWFLLFGADLCFFFHLHSVCVHTTVLLLPQSPYESPVNLVPSSQPVSPWHSSVYFLFSLRHHTLSIILLPWSLMWMSVVFICCVCVCGLRGIVGLQSILTDIAEFTV